MIRPSPTISIFLIVLFAGFSICAQEKISFSELVAKLEGHSGIKSLKDSANAKEKMAPYSSSLSNPNFRIDALNIPIDDFGLGNTPMSGIRFSLSQKFPLTGRLSLMESSMKEEARTVDAMARSKQRSLEMSLWKVLIKIYDAGIHQSILNENISWLDRMLDVTKKKYETGGATQESLLDLEVRKSSIKSEVSAKTKEISGFFRELALVIDEPASDYSIDLQSVPFDWLNTAFQVSQSKPLPEEEQVIHSEKSIEYELRSSKREWVPDLTVGINYRYRKPALSDEGDDFIGGFISLPIPLFKRPGVKSAALLAESESLRSARKDIRNRQEGNIQMLKEKVAELKAEHSVLKDETIQLAVAQRDVTAKNYSVGVADYVSLLKSQLQLQDLKIRELKLSTEIKKRAVDLLYEQGHNLFPKNLK